MPAEFIPKWNSYFTNIASIDRATLAVGIGALLTIVLLKKFAPKLPGYLMAVVLAAGAVFFFDLNIATIGSRFPDIASGMPVPKIPVWDFNKIKDIIPSAFTIAFLAGIEALLSAVVADGMTGYKHRSNQELIGNGLANVASAFFCGLPATGAIARTATNIKAGGKTPMAGIFHAVFILLFLLFATNMMTFVPLAALSAILFVVSWNMSEIPHFVRIFTLSKNDRIVMILTFALTVLIDLTVAIGVGVTLASLLFMHKMSTAPSIHAQGNHIRDVLGDAKDEGEQREELPEGVEVFRINGPIFFGMAATMLDTLSGIGNMPRVLIIRMKHVPYIDVAGVGALQGIIAECRKNGSIIIFSALYDQPKEMFDKAKIKQDGKMLFFAPNYDDSIVLAKHLVSTTSLEGSLIKVEEYLLA